MAFLAGHTLRNDGTLRGIAILRINSKVFDWYAWLRGLIFIFNRFAELFQGN